MDREDEHGGGAGAHDVNRVRFPGPDDPDVKVVTDLPGGWVCESSRSQDAYFAPRLLAMERAEDRLRWRGRASWHPVLTYSTVLIASGWLAGAWYAWQIDGDGSELTICLVGCLSTLFPGIPWQELIDISKREHDRP